MAHIVYGIDDKYFPCLLVSMYSLLKTVSGPLKITVLVAEPEVEDASDIHKMADHFPNLTLDIRRFEAGDFEEYKKSEIAERFPAASMIPLFIPWLIDDKCLFLDADTLILHDISELYRTDLKGCLIGACRESGFAVRHYRYFSSVLRTLLPSKGKRKRESMLEAAERVGFSIHELVTHYFNSGVILMNAPAIRNADPSGDLMNINSAREHWEALPDQNWLNEFFKDRAHYLDLKWNVYRDYSSLDGFCAPPGLWPEISRANKDPGLLHFTNTFGRQPWRRPWYRARKRYRIYRQMCREMEEKMGIRIFRLFDARLTVPVAPNR